ncbi:MAG: outer membrane beta-barrel protein [Salibacteraceae bacterium]
MLKNSLHFILVFFLFAPVIGLSQELKIDSNQVEEDNNKRPHQDLLMIDLTWERLLGTPNGVEQKWYGRGINLGLLYDYPLNRNGNVSGAIGLGFQSHNYYLNSIVNRYDSGGVNYSAFNVVGDTILDRGKISVNYVDIPIEVRFRTNENPKGQRWKFAIGGKVGYLIQAHEKLINNQDIKVKTYDYPHISQWRYGVSARVGYGSVMLSAFYSLTPFFESGNSTSQQNALSIGISIVPF